MNGKNLWRIVIAGALLALAIVDPAKAIGLFTHGPNFNVSFSPADNAQVGQDVNIHIKVDSTNPGAAKISVGCGNVSKAETSEVEFDSIWHTGNCNSGTISISICTKASDDPLWQDPNCRNFGYVLFAGNSAPQPVSQTPSQSDIQSSNNIYPGTDGNCGGLEDDGTYNWYACGTNDSTYLWSEPSVNSEVVGDVTTTIEDYKNSKVRSVCNQGFSWSYIQKGSVSGWVPWGSRQDRSDCPVPPSPVTAVPTLEIQTSEQEPVFDSEPGPVIETNGSDPGGVVKPVLADEIPSPFALNECTDYVWKHRSDAPNWVQHGGGNGDAKNWPRYATTFGSLYGVTIDQGDLTKAQPGDIVVWSGNCGLGSAGHVAILVKRDGNTLIVNEANWCKDGVCDHKVHNGTKYTFKSSYISCLTFIHNPAGSPVVLSDQPASATPSNSFMDWLKSQWWWPFK